MASYAVTTENWNDPGFWSGIDETGSGHALDFGALPSGYTVATDAGSGIITIENGSSTFSVGGAGTSGTDASFGGSTTLAQFTLLQGGAGGDALDGTRGSDFIDGDAGSDTIDGGGGADKIDGGDGGDSLSGGAGDDVIHGGITAEDAALHLEWSAAGADEADISGGFTQNTGGIAVAVSYSDDGNGRGFSVESTASQYVGAGEPFSGSSAGQLNGGGNAGDTATVTLDFSARPGSGFEDEVTDVRFRINDLDAGRGRGWEDEVTIRAYDAEGNLLDVTITYQGASETGTAPAQDGEGSSSADSAGGSLLVEIAGPVSYIEIDYDQLGGSGQVLYVSDVHFTAVGRGDGDDTIDGGDGADMVLGGEGDDRITVDRGDTAEGGAGDDTFVLEDADDSRSGNAAISITGGEGDESEGDTLILTPDVSRDDITFTETDDDAGGLSGSFTTDDGTLVEFTEIENIICFTPGTMILTEMGERPVETLRPGDRVVTRDSGVQPIRWRGKRRVDGRGRFAPVRVAPTVAGEGRQALLVSPQHRLLYTGYQAQLLFGQEEVLVAAKHLIDGAGIRRCRMEEVTYIHLMFDHHEVIYAEGIATESFHAGDVGLSALCEAAREELFALFPELRSAPRHLGDTARQCLKQYEARLLVDTEQARGALVG